MKFECKAEADFWRQIFVAYVQNSSDPDYQGSSGRALRAHFAEKEADEAIEMFRERGGGSWVR